MIKLEDTIKLRVETEEEAKLAMEQLKEEAREKGYIISKYSWTKKKRNQKERLLMSDFWLVVLGYTIVFGGYDLWLM